MVERSESVPQARTNKIPMFMLDGLGGVDVFRRWIRLCNRRWRAVSPIVGRLTYGLASPEVRLIEVAVAIEYWVAAHRRQTTWAKKGNAPTPAEALARHVGTPFSDWVGDLSAWSAKFTEYYNKLKHEPDFKYSPQEVGMLAISGEALLTAALLNRVAGSKQPSRTIFVDYEFGRLGETIRTWWRP